MAKHDNACTSPTASHAMIFKGASKKVQVHMKTPSHDLQPSIQERIISRLKLLGIPSQRLLKQPKATDPNQKAINQKKYDDYRTALKKRIDAGEFNLPESPSEKQLIQSPTFLPDSHCVICQKTIEEIGGRRLVAQQVRGILISNKPIGGGHRDHHYKSHKLSPYPLYLVVWGPGTIWSGDAIQRATAAFHKGKRSWFCQLCGNRVCLDCGSPSQMPVGSDVLYENGCTAHVAILPCHPGCVNPQCKNHKEVR
ncbi:MAG: hypothetical protein KJ630_14680 [Proteobacteria bacterium]|nr:hypothetical protein [Pseudomonadota bacterium]